MINSDKHCFKINPLTIIYHPDITYAIYVESKRNPVAQALYNKDLDNNYLIQFNTTASYQILKELKFTTLFNAALNNETNNQFSPSSLTSGGTGDATGSNTFDKTVNWEVQTYFNYNKKFGKYHSFGATAGFSADKWRNDFYTIAMSKYVTENINTSNAGVVDLTKTRTTAWARSNASFFGRLNYSFGSK